MSERPPECDHDWQLVKNDGKTFTDLMHFCDTIGSDYFDNTVRIARANHTVEKDEESNG